MDPHGISSSDTTLCYSTLINYTIFLFHGKTGQAQEAGEEEDADDEEEEGKTFYYILVFFFKMATLIELLFPIFTYSHSAKIKNYNVVTRV